MSWTVYKSGHQVGKTYDTRIEALTEAKEKGHVIIIKSKPYLAEGVEIKEIPEVSDLIKEYRFTVRETLRRDRIYKIKAKNEEEARDLLDGFKQTPEEEDACQENIEVSEYDIKHVSRNDPKIGEKVVYLDKTIGYIVEGEAKSYVSILLVRKEGSLVQTSYSILDWDEEDQTWYQIKESK